MMKLFDLMKKFKYMDICFTKLNYSHTECFDLKNATLEGDIIMLQNLCIRNTSDYKTEIYMSAEPNGTDITCIYLEDVELYLF